MPPSSIPSTPVFAPAPRPLQEILFGGGDHLSPERVELLLRGVQSFTVDGLTEPGSGAAVVQQQAGGAAQQAQQQAARPLINSTAKEVLGAVFSTRPTYVQVRPAPPCCGAVPGPGRPHCAALVQPPCPPAACLRARRAVPAGPSAWWAHPCRCLQELLVNEAVSTVDAAGRQLAATLLNPALGNLGPAQAAMQQGGGAGPNGSLLPAPLAVLTRWVHREAWRQRCSWTGRGCLAGPPLLTPLRPSACPSPFESLPLKGPEHNARQPLLAPPRPAGCLPLWSCRPPTSSSCAPRRPSAPWSCSSRQRQVRS